MPNSLDIKVTWAETSKLLLLCNIYVRQKTHVILTVSPVSLYILPLPEMKNACVMYWKRQL